MQAIAETVFDFSYLTTVLVLGTLMLNKRNAKQYRLFGVMAVILGLGDAFHLLPRALALCTTGLESYTTALGIGKCVTSLSMTIFYILIYHVWRLRYEVEGKEGVTISVYALAILRIFLCLMPQNAWTSAAPPLSWGIYRNLPFVALGILIIVLFYQSTKKSNDKPFRHMWITIVLSFAFYIPVVLFTDTIPAIGVLMIPKTCAYIWIILIGYHEMKALRQF